MGLKDWLGGNRRDAHELDVAVQLVSIGGPPELSNLLIDIPAADILRGLDAWRWLPLSGFTVVAVSAFGDVFLRDDASAVHQIDTIEGKLSKVADSTPGLAAMLQDGEARDSLLLAGLVIGARNRGLTLEPGECYDFRLAPVVGGKMSVDDIEKRSFVVKLHIAGQLHEQVKNLPPGTPIGNMTFSP